MASSSSRWLFTRSCVLLSARSCHQNDRSLAGISSRCCIGRVLASPLSTSYTISNEINAHLPLQTGVAKFAHCSCIPRIKVAINATNPYIYNTTRQFTSPTDSTDCKNAAPKLSLYQKFKAMYKDYWYVLLPVHLVTSAGWFGGLYYMASSGFDIISLLESLNVSDKLISPFRNGHATTGYLAISYALYKIATPLRYTVTLGGTTVSINYLKKWGYIKPVPSKEELKAIYQGKKDSFKEKGQNLKENMIQSLKPSANQQTNYEDRYLPVLPKRRH